VLAATVRCTVVLTPLVASAAVGIMASRLFRPVGVPALLGWLLWTAAVSIAVLAVMDAAVRRLLPLHRLLQLCLVFPDRAPSRLRIAVQAARPRRPERMAAADEVPRRAADAAARVVRLLAALSVHDRRTRGHSERVCAYTELLAEQMQLEQPERDRLMWVALVHDIGQLAVPRRLLNKPGRPTVSEWNVLQAHPARGGAIIAPLRDWLGSWADAVEQHHERFDGKGYPVGLRGEQICAGARILAVTDAFEVMTAPRAYRRPVDAQAARAELARYAGTQFDPVVVRNFLAVGLPELRRAMGLVAWLGQLPFIRDWPRLQSTTAAASAQAATSTALASTAGLLVLGAGTAAATAAPGASAHSLRTMTESVGQNLTTGDSAPGSAGQAGTLVAARTAPVSKHPTTASDRRPQVLARSVAKTGHGLHRGWWLGPSRRSQRAAERAHGPHGH
jgi:hypothetical protein